MKLIVPKIIIFDLDGTLNYHILSRVINFFNLVIVLLLKNLKLRDLKILINFRKLQEISFKKDMQINEVFELLACRFSVSPDYIKGIRDRWMVNNQRLALKISKRGWLIKRIHKLRRNGMLVAVWSDNPVNKKICYLGVNFDYKLTSEALDINLGKPSPKGLKQIISYFHLISSDAIMIGDRKDRDGEAARRAGVKFLKIGIRTRFFLYKLDKQIKR
jgi:histidinol phosphatase-like enzyme